MAQNEAQIEACYQQAREIYKEYGVDTDDAIKRLATVEVSVHCWQGDDVTGFEIHRGPAGGGIMATGNHPGRARTGDELRQDLEQAFRLIPGKCRLNLHAIYAETGGRPVDRDQLTLDHFKTWIDWARERQMGLDFNPTFFAHELAVSGYTLASKDRKVRDFWIEHAKRCREIGAGMGRALGTPCVHNLWIPDGSKDLIVDRLGHRQILKESLDAIYGTDYDRRYLVDTVESKVFGIGSEAYVAGSHEFYLGYALKNNLTLCLDMGHFHPTESVADKVSALLTVMDQVLIHVSRGLRWDSDHVVILNDDLLALTQEIVRAQALERVYFALDFFDASINRVAAWVIGCRALRKGLLAALLEPTQLLLREETVGNFGRRLALLEEIKSLPFGAVWDQYCLNCQTPVGREWLEQATVYEQTILKQRV